MTTTICSNCGKQGILGAESNGLFIWVGTKSRPQQPRYLCRSCWGTLGISAFETETDAVIQDNKTASKAWIQQMHDFKRGLPVDDPTR